MKMREGNLRNHIDWVELMLLAFNAHLMGCVCKVCCELRAIVNKINSENFYTGIEIQSRNDLLKLAIPQDKAKEYYLYLSKKTAEYGNS